MRIGLITDLHWMQEPPAAAAAWHGGGEFAAVLDRVDRALEHFAAEEVERVVVAGDLSHHGDHDSVAAVLDRLRGASAPVLLVGGNHDLDGDDPERLPRAVAEASIPGLSLARPEGERVDWLQIAGVHVGASEGWFEASLGGAQARVLPRSESLVLISHYPVLSLAREVAARGLPYPGDLLDREAIASELAARPDPTIVLSGHLHVRATATAGPVLQLSAGALVEPPYECALVEIERDAGDIFLTRRCLRLLGNGRANEPVLAPDQEAWRFDGREWAEDVAGAPEGAREVPPTRTEGA